MGGRGGGVRGGGGGGYDHVTQTNRSPAIYGGFLLVYTQHVAFDVQQHEARSQVVMTFANMPETLLFTAFLSCFYAMLQEDA